MPPSDPCACVWAVWALLCTTRSYSPLAAQSSLAPIAIVPVAAGKRGRKKKEVPLPPMVNGDPCVHDLYPPTHDFDADGSNGGAMLVPGMGMIPTVLHKRGRKKKIKPSESA